jgi:hypothetical protein
VEVALKVSRLVVTLVVVVVGLVRLYKVDGMMVQRVVPLVVAPFSLQPLVEKID